MTELDIYTFQKDLSYFIEQRFNQFNIPPILQRMILDKIYLEVLLKANKYEHEIYIQDKLEEEKRKAEEKEKEESSFAMTDSRESSSVFSESLKNISPAETQEVDDNITYI